MNRVASRDERDTSQPLRAGSSGSSSDSTTAVAEIIPATRGQTLSRRGHFKSRLGCFNCKRRRVKCNELRPSCSPCLRLGLLCDYPAVASGTLSTPVISSTLSLADLQFFHRFLTVAFPTLPIRADEVWGKCAGMSYQVRTANNLTKVKGREIILTVRSSPNAWLTRSWVLALRISHSMETLTTPLRL